MMSMFRSMNLSFGGVRLMSGVLVCLLTFDNWQGKHEATNDFAIAGQTKLFLTKCFVASTPGWLRLCSCAMMFCRKAAVTNGRRKPVEESQVRVVPKASGAVCRTSVVELFFFRFCSSGSVCWAKARVAASTTIGGEIDSILESASAAELSTPAMCRISFVYWLIKSSCRSCRWFVTFSLLERAEIKGLWSVNTVSFRPSTSHLKWRMHWKIASSSLS